MNRKSLENDTSSMQSERNMSIVMSLPLKKRPFPRVDFSNVEELARPEKRMKADTCFCQKCVKFFTSKTRYRAHLRRHSSKLSGRYQCKECDKNFVQRSSLTTHMRIHTGERPFKCPDCPDSFGDFSTFTKHQRIHTGEKPYQCPVCDRKFSQSGNMHRHLKSVHTKVNPDQQVFSIQVSRI